MSQGSNGAPPPFFADSDNEEPMKRNAEDIDMLDAGSSATDKSAPRDSAPLFFADSDDDEPVEQKPTQLPLLALDQAMADLSDDVEIPELDEPPRASSVSSASSNHDVRAQSRSPSVIVEESALDRRTKKRKLSPQYAQATTSFDLSYLGSFLVPNAWSTVRGSGYVKAGDEIRVERDSPDEDTPPSKPAKSKAGSNKDSKNKGSKKQISIATMLKPAPAKFSKKKKDLVVRLTNMRGFGEYMLCMLRSYVVTPLRIRPTASGYCVLGIKTIGPRYHRLVYALDSTLLTYL